MTVFLRDGDGIALFPTEVVCVLLVVREKVCVYTIDGYIIEKRRLQSDFSANHAADIGGFRRQNEFPVFIFLRNRHFTVCRCQLLVVFLEHIVFENGLAIIEEHALTAIGDVACNDVGVFFCFGVVPSLIEFVDGTKSRRFTQILTKSQNCVFHRTVIVDSANLTFTIVFRSAKHIMCGIAKQIRVSAARTGTANRNREFLIGCILAFSLGLGLVLHLISVRCCAKCIDSGEFTIIIDLYSVIDFHNRPAVRHDGSER